MVWYSAFKVEKTKPGVVADVCNPSSWEATSRPAWTVRPSLERQKNNQICKRRLGLPWGRGSSEFPGKFLKEMAVFWMGSWAEQKTCYWSNFAHRCVLLETDWPRARHTRGKWSEPQLFFCSITFRFDIKWNLKFRLIKLCRLDLELIVIQVGIEFNLPASASRAAITVWTTTSFLR